MQPIIEVSNLSKKYNIGRRKGGYVAMRDVLTNTLKNPLGAAKYRIDAWSGKITQEDFWALKDINFQINKGEAVGIIGTNGSGKSTLLKILTKITPPTSGEVRLRGKVASLLEVGTGFHPELTGRENIFLNGAILGMHENEIRSKFDAIVAFSGVEKFIDTPVKHYSSGMYVRLAFSVAAHLEPDILLIDEVLAVGDAAFQKKCLGKMDEVTKNRERTILFVSHNMSAIQSLCSRCILIDQGKLKAFGETKKIIDTYLKTTVETGISLKNRHDRKQMGNVRLTGFYIEHNAKRVNSLETGKDYSFCFSYQSLDKKRLKNVSFWSAVYHESGLPLIQIDTNYTNQNFEDLPPKGTVKCQIPKLPLVSGLYQISAVVKSVNSVDIIKNAGTIEVRAGNYFGQGIVEEHGQIFVKHDWNLVA